MLFTPEGYKIVEICFFGKVSQFANEFSVGDVVLFKNPAVLKSQTPGGPNSLLIKNEEKVLHIGESEDFGMCKSLNCPAFVNKQLQELCTLHTNEENQLKYNQIRAQRAYL